jgi:hypothetical protein
MATSGTLGQTTFTAVQAIEHAYRRCGKTASTVGQEQLQVAKDNLSLILISLVNEGLNLWCVEKLVLPVFTDQITYPMPIGTVDVKNVFYRTSTTATPTWTTATSSWTGDFGATTATAVATIAFVPTSTQSLALAVETSSDNVTYSNALTIASASYAAGTPYYFDIDPATSAQYIRLRETTGAVMTLDSVTTITDNVEIPIARINRDDYTGLPDKRSTGTPTQFWFDRQITPQMWLWPMPSTASSISVWRQRDVQDVGALLNNIEIPGRWFDGIAWKLAARLSYEIPDMDPNKQQSVLAMADRVEGFAASEEYDNSPVYVTYNLRGYNA